MRSERKDEEEEEERIQLDYSAVKKNPELLKLDVEKNFKNISHPKSILSEGNRVIVSEKRADEVKFSTLSIEIAKCGMKMEARLGVE